MTSTAARERRWIVLAENGQHSTVGRQTDPTEDELARAAEALKQIGMGGWLAVTEGHYHHPKSRTLP